jgi:hypothetical protein
MKRLRKKAQPFFIYLIKLRSDLLVKYQKVKNLTASTIFIC